MHSRVSRQAEGEAVKPLPPQRVEKLRHASQKCKHFFEGMQATARTSSGQSPHRSPRPDGQGSLRSLAPSLPNKPASLGFVWVPGSHTCGLGSVFSDVHAAGKHDLTLFRRLRDGGTLRGSCSINRRNILYRQSETGKTLQYARFFPFSPFFDYEKGVLFVIVIPISIIFFITFFL